MNRIVLVAFLLVAALNGCGKSTPPTAQEGAPQTAVADCCQCVTPGTPTTPSTPVACATGTTDQAACDQTCGNNVGGIMAGSCSDGVRCQ
jgi:hypothetical protein